MSTWYLFLSYLILCAGGVCTQRHNICTHMCMFSSIELLFKIIQNSYSPDTNQKAWFWPPSLCFHVCRHRMTSPYSVVREGIYFTVIDNSLLSLGRHWKRNWLSATQASWPQITEKHHLGQLHLRLPILHRWKLEMQCLYQLHLRIHK